MRYLSASLAIFRQLLLAARALGQPSNLGTAVDEAGNREPHTSRKLKWELRLWVLSFTKQNAYVVENHTQYAPKDQ